MPLDLSDLEPASCPLLQGSSAAHDRLIASFNRLTLRFRTLDRSDLALTGESEWNRLAGRLDRLRQDLARTTFRVGLLGSAQVGKSTVLSHLLCLDTPEAAIVQPGTGALTSDLVVHVRPQKEGADAFTLHYLTPDELLQRRASLCGACGFGSELSDDAIRALIPSRIDSVRAGKEPGVAEEQVGLFESLDAFLRASRSEQAAYVRSPRRVDLLDREAWQSVVRTVADDRGRIPPVPTPLVRFALLEIAAHRLPPNVELVLVPSLRGGRSDNEVRARETIGQLNAGLVFTAANLVYDEALIQWLTPQVRLPDPVRTNHFSLVVTKIDTLTVSGRESTDAFFQAVQRVLGETGLPVDHLFFVATPWVGVRRDEIERIVRDLFADLDQAPKTWEEPIGAEPTWPKIAGAFRKLLDQGGIPHLRDFLSGSLRVHLRDQWRMLLESELISLEHDLERWVEAQEQRESLSQTQLGKVLSARNQIRWLILRLETADRELRVFGEAADALLSNLRRDLDTVVKGAVLTSRLPDAEEFAAHAMYLDGTLDKVVRSKVVPLCFRGVDSLLDAISTERIGTRGSLSSVWSEITRPDIQDLRWLRIPAARFASGELFAEGRGARSVSAFDAEWYMNLLGEKATVVTYRILNTIRQRLRSRLIELCGDLSLTIGPDRLGRPDASPGEAARPPATTP